MLKSDITALHWFFFFSSFIVFFSSKICFIFMFSVFLLNLFCFKWFFWFRSIILLSCSSLINFRTIILGFHQEICGSPFFWGQLMKFIVSFWWFYSDFVRSLQPCIIFVHSRNQPPLPNLWTRFSKDIHLQVGHIVASGTSSVEHQLQGLCDGSRFIVRVDMGPPWLLGLLESSAVPPVPVPRDQNGPQ